MVDPERIRTLHDALRKQDYYLSVAESCTGGLLGGAITSVPGSSDVFRGGVTAYANRIKKKLLDVPGDILEREGAVSEPVADRMARGVSARFETGTALSITGIAGPGGGTKKKPVGLVFLGVKVGSVCQVERDVFDGDRQTVRARTVSKAVDLLLNELTESSGS